MAVPAEGMDGGCAPAPRNGELAELFSCKRIGLADNGGHVGRCQGFGEGSPSIPYGLHGIHEAMCDPKGIENGIHTIVDNQQEVDVVGHDHEVRNCRAWKEGVQGKKRGFYRLALDCETGSGLLIFQLGQHVGALFHGERDEEELPPAVVILHFHW